MYGSGVMSNDRIAGFLNEASGVDFGLSEGSVYGFCARFARKAESTVARLAEEQAKESVLCTDATTNGKRSYIRCVSSGAAVIFYAMESKSVAALEKISLLAGYRTTMRRRYIILDRVTRNAMSIFSGICARTRRIPGTAGRKP